MRLSVRRTGSCLRNESPALRYGSRIPLLQIENNLLLQQQSLRFDCERSLIMPKMQSAPAKSGPFSVFVRSAQELKRPKSLVMLSMLLACHVVLGFFQLQVTDFLRISFAALPIGVAGMLYGPTAALLLGALGDPIKYLVSPTGPFFPGFTLSAAVTGLLFGLLLYGMHQNFAPCRKKRVVAILRVAAAQLLNTLLVDLLLHTLWLSCLYGTPMAVLLPMRAVKCALMFPVEGVLLYLLLAAVARFLLSRPSTLR